MDPRDRVASMCITAHMEPLARAELVRKCLSSMCVALRFLRPAPRGFVYTVDPTFPAAARRLVRAAGVRLATLQSPLLRPDSLPPPLAERLRSRCGSNSSHADAERVLTKQDVHKYAGRLYSFDKLLALQQAGLRGARRVLWLDADALVVDRRAATPPTTESDALLGGMGGTGRDALTGCTVGAVNRRAACPEGSYAMCEAQWRRQECGPLNHRRSRAAVETNAAFLNNGVMFLPAPTHSSAAASDGAVNGAAGGGGDVYSRMVARLVGGNFSWFRSFPPGARVAFGDQDIFAYHLAHEEGCRFVDLGACFAWRAKGMRPCRGPDAPYVVHSTFWWRDAALLAEAGAHLRARNCSGWGGAALSRAETRRLCAHAPLPAQREVCKRIGSRPQ